MKKLFISYLLSFAMLTITFAQDEGEPAPDFSFKDYEGNEFILSEQLGKVVFIFTFGNTCPSCLAFGNKTETMVNDVYGSRDDFVAVGVDFWNSSSSNTSVSNFAEQTGITYPLLVKGGDMASAYNTTYDRLLVVDREGILRHKGNTLANNDFNNALEVLEEYLGTSVSTGLGSFQGEFDVYPTPANQLIKISFYLDGDSDIGINLFNSLGQLQNVQYNGYLTAGKNSVQINVSSLEEGLYFYQFERNERVTHSGRLLIKR